MSDDVFDGQMLADKLFKLNSSQQTLSRLCISQRKKARQIVEIWHKSFKSAQREQHVSFLYLANDILQNSRRKGNEFVNEFWKVMPSTLKHVHEHGDENGKKAASRLVGIWDERRVFGSRGQNLKDEMLGKSPLPQLASNGKSSNPIKIVKRDANSLRLKLAIGGTPEKIMTAFHLVHDENATEDTALNNCEGAVRRFGDLERDIESKGVLPGPSLLEEIQEQENVLQECVNQLETAERTRTSLISQLKVALQDQVARHQIDHAVNLRKKLVSPATQNQPGDMTIVDGQSMSFGTTHVTEEENKKAAAAAVAAKLAASTSSAQMLTSVLSSLVAEEAASISSGAGFSSTMFSPEKRPKLEKPMSVSDLSSNSDAVSSGGYFNQTSFPPPPPPSITSPANNQFVQSSGLVMGGMPYGYGGASSSLPPPPPLPSHIAMGLMRPATHHHQQTASSGYYRPPGIGFYGQSHQPTPPPPVPRQ
ncbi:CID domain-containing protein [Cynara cardunculus var. scolymus]|uniref:CID domain-containing protein n=1 Tax=Cynara cardunculus var. scolymus TaxID=59895 RepID=A0A103XPU7_CYNCS|nr:CID domain-containing protein [Cynara cardunculus var. scolymus]